MRGYGAALRRPGISRLAAQRATLDGAMPRVAIDFKRSEAAIGGGSRPLADLPGLAFTETGTRYVANAAGLLVPFGPDVLPMAAGVGLKLSDAITNLHPRSEDIGGSGWTTLGASVSSNALADPAGGTGMDLITDSGSGGGYTRYGPLTVEAETEYTFSFWANVTAGTVAWRAYDISNTAQIMQAVYTAESLARKDFQFTTPAGCTSVYVYPVYNLSAAGSVGCWGAQVNAGGSVLDYVPTAGASASAGASAFTLDMAALGLSDTQTFNYERDGGSTGTVDAVAGTLTLDKGFIWEALWA